MTTKDIEQLKLNLRQFTGDLKRYMHTGHHRLVYTPGIKFLCEEAECYWLLDAIVAWMGSKAFSLAVHKDERIGQMYFWRLEVAEDNTAVLSARADSDVEPFIVQSIPLTDFPLEEIDIWAAWDGTFWTIYLPSEH